MSAGLVGFFVLLAVMTSFYAMFAPVNKNAARIAARPLAEGSQTDTPFERWIRPAIRNFLPQTPMALTEYARKNDGVTALLARTGNPWRVGPEEYVVLRVLAIIAGIMLLSILSAIGYMPLPVFMAMPVGAFLGFIAPKALLDSAWAKRRRNINRTLPEALDLLRICMNAGYNFPNAMAQTVELLPQDTMRMELERVLAEVRAGRPLTVAMSTFATRCPTDGVEAFVRAINQGQATGADIAETLTYQSEEARNEYERMVELRAQKLQTTMFFPIIAVFLPILMAIIFAPSLQQLGAIL